MKLLARPSVRAWLVSRAAVLALMALATWLQVRHGFGRSPVRPDGSGFFAWDGAWYREIAEHAYDRDEALRFFPLYPLLSLTGAGLVVVANLAALAYAEGLARLTALELGDRAGERVPWLALLNPASFVLVIAYAEAPAAALAVWCLYAARRGRWGHAGWLAFAAGLTRPFGLLLALPLAVEAWRAPSVRRAVAAAAAPAGCAAYLLWCALARGDALAPFRVQQRGDLRGGVLVWPGPAAARAWRALLELGPWNLALRLVLVPAFVALLVVAARRLPASYTAYAAAILLLALGTPRWASFERYALTAFPLLMAASSLRSRLGTVTTRAASFLGLGVYAILAFSNRYVP
ncbi:MAG TPA: hypothetical protein VF519_15045 [Mycobacteriales bacterium]